MYCNHMARATFFFAHGVLIMTVSSNLHRWPEVPWRLVFLPAWLGNACGIATLVASWFASCPYVKLCMAEKQPRVGMSNPSILTEVLPDIVLSFAGLGFLVLMLISEVVLCHNLSSIQAGSCRTSPAAVILFSLVGVLAICHGTCTTYSSPLFISAGVGLLLTALTATFTACSAAQSTQALTFAPAVLAAAGLLVATLQHRSAVKHVLSRIERQVSSLELLAKVALLTSSTAFAVGVAQKGFAKVAVEGNLSGALVCVLAMMRVWLCHLEVRNGPLLERLLAAPSPPQASPAGASVRTVRLTGSTTSSSVAGSGSVGPAEVQISIRSNDGES